MRRRTTTNMVYPWRRGGEEVGESNMIMRKMKRMRWRRWRRRMKEDEGG
jgi:hypothetical protein